MANATRTSFCAALSEPHFLHVVPIFWRHVFVLLWIASALHCMQWKTGFSTEIVWFWNASISCVQFVGCTFKTLHRCAPTSRDGMLDKSKDYKRGLNLVILSYNDEPIYGGRSQCLWCSRRRRESVYSWTFLYLGDKPGKESFQLGWNIAHG